jgi:UDP-N-acetylmuramate--alanine ligase
MHVYFSGIGGVGIGPLAMLALDAGYTVSGSDIKQSEMVSFLRDRGARVQIGQDGSQVANEHIEKPIEWFVYSSALPADHIELKFAREHGIKVSKRDEFLNEILKQKQLRLIAVSGTHGKTTTTGMLVWLFKQLGIPVSYSIGTSISFGPPAQYQQGSEYFVYECDEFDRNFLNFYPSYSLIPSLDYDHADTYPTQEDYNYAFNEFVAQSSLSFMWQEVANQLGLADTTTSVILSPSDPGKDLVKLAGEHTRRNAWLAVKTLQAALGKDTSELVAHINSFPGTNRRFEKLAESLYTDYAHHPVEIAATIEMAKELNKNVIVVYQPHQNIRQHEILKENGYKHCFDGATAVYWLPTYLSRENESLPLLSPTDLMANTSGETSTEPVEMNELLVKKITSHLKKGDLVVGMAAGDLDHWLRSTSW